METITSEYLLDGYLKIRPAQACESFGLCGYLELANPVRVAYE